jgi:hypothetical protein
MGYGLWAMGYRLWVTLDLAVPSIMGSDAAHSP